MGLKTWYNGYMKTEIEFTYTELNKWNIQLANAGDKHVIRKVMSIEITEDEEQPTATGFIKVDKKKVEVMTFDVIEGKIDEDAIWMTSRLID